MKRYYCTLFDENYLLRGLALHQSLEKNSTDYHLFILAMTELAYVTLEKLKLPNVTLIHLENEFLDEELKKIRPTRTAVEFCWTLTPSLPTFILKQNPEIELISYIDADCFFFSSPEPLFQEFGKKDVLIIEHRYSRGREYMEKTSGRFNVGLVSFRNSEAGREVLEDWRVRCNEWCYYRYEDGKLGDQLYLDAWPKDFSGVHILKHNGACVAPWNMDRWRLSRTKTGQPLISGQPLVFYHYHGFRLFDDFTFYPAKGYDFTQKVIDAIYTPYIQSLKSAFQNVAAVDNKFTFGFSPPETIPQPMTLKLKTKEILRGYKRAAKNFIKSKIKPYLPSRPL